MYALKNEPFRVIWSNVVKNLPWNEHPSKVVSIGDIQTQIEFLYLTPYRIRCKGWIASKREIAKITLIIKDRAILMEYPLLRKDISKRYMISDMCGFACVAPSQGIFFQDFKQSIFQIELSNNETITYQRDLTKLIEESQYSPSKQGLSSSKYKSVSDKTSHFPLSPSVAILIPFKDKVHLLERLMLSILEQTKFENYKIYLLNNGSVEPATILYVGKITKDYNFIDEIHIPGEFNYAKMINIGMKKAKADFFLLLNNDTKVLTEGWIEKVVRHFEDPNVSVVGTKLLYPDLTIQHAGVIVSNTILTRHIWQDFSSDLSDEHHSNMLRKTSAVTGACMMIRAIDVQNFGGLDEKLAVTLNDIDYCLRMIDNNKIVLYDPNVSLIHYESMSRGVHDVNDNWERTMSEVKFFKNRWKKWLKNGDPYI